MTMKCDRCGKSMTEGYYYYGTHLCEDCRHEQFTDDEWNAEYDEDCTEAYWTDWSEA